MNGVLSDPGLLLRLESQISLKIQGLARGRVVMLSAFSVGQVSITIFCSRGN